MQALSYKATLPAVSGRCVTAYCGSAEHNNVKILASMAALVNQVGIPEPFGFCSRTETILKKCDDSTSHAVDSTCDDGPERPCRMQG